MKRIPRTAPVATLAVALLGAPDVSAQEGPTCERIIVRGAQARSPQVHPEVSARRSPDAEFNILFPDAFTGEHLLRLELRTPRGHLYKRQTVPITDDPQAKPARRVRGYPRPVAVHMLQPDPRAGSNGRVVKVRLPIAGTSITTSSLYGRWRIEVFVDGARQGCAAAEFTVAE